MTTNEHRAGEPAYGEGREKPDTSFGKTADADVGRQIVEYIAEWSERDKRYADAIELSVRDSKALSAYVSDLQARLEEAERERQRIREETDDLDQVISDREAALSRLQEENGRLRKALKPFAELRFGPKDHERARALTTGGQADAD